MLLPSTRLPAILRSQSITSRFVQFRLTHTFLHTQKMSIDTLRQEDYAQWSELWRQYLEFYKTTLPESQYKNTWSRILSPQGDLHGFVLRDNEGKLIGLAHYLFHTGSWSDKPVCYLNDLYVDPSTRGKGLGRSLIQATAKAAREKDCSKFYWSTQENNATARRLYDSLATTEFVLYKMPLDSSK